MQTTKSYALTAITHPSTPGMGRLFQATIGDFMDNLAGYAKVGLIQTILDVIVVSVFPVMMQLAMSFFFLLYGIPGYIASDMAHTSGVSSELIGFAVRTLVVLYCGSVGLSCVAFLAGLRALIAPVTAGLSRAIAQHQRGEGGIEFNGVFRTVTQDLIPVVVVTAIVSSIILIGAAFCYLPGVVATGLLSFAPSLVFLHRRSSWDAVRTSVRYAIANPAFSVVFACVVAGVSMLAPCVPVFGGAFVLALRVRAFREVFGDSPSL